jgi:TolB protein
LAYVSQRNGDSDVYVVDADGRNDHPVAANRSEEATPVWSPDDVHIAFVSDRDGIRHIYVVAADGSGLRRLSPTPGPDFDPRYRPTG